MIWMYIAAGVVILATAIIFTAQVVEERKRAKESKHQVVKVFTLTNEEPYFHETGLFHVYRGGGVPANEVGSDGDAYYDMETTRVYKKYAGMWIKVELPPDLPWK